MIERKIDELGRLVIPKGMRRMVGLSENCLVDIFIDGENIIIRKAKHVCRMCNTERNLQEIKGSYICSDCILDINKEADKISNKDFEIIKNNMY